MKKHILPFSFLILLCWTSLQAQSEIASPKTNTEWSLFWNGSLDLNSERFNSNKFTAVGFETKIHRVFENGLGIEAKFSYRSWSDSQRRLVPLLVGPSYTILSAEKINLLIRSGIGPELIIGNDYASIFLGYEIGPEFRYKIGQGSSVFFGIAFAQAMAAHPDHFEYLDLTVGWQF